MDVRRTWKVTEVPGEVERERDTEQAKGILKKKKKKGEKCGQGNYHDDGCMCR